MTAILNPFATTVEADSVDLRAMIDDLAGEVASLRAQVAAIRGKVKTRKPSASDEKILALLGRMPGVWLSLPVIAVNSGVSKANTALRLRLLVDSGRVVRRTDGARTVLYALPS